MANDVKIGINQLSAALQETLDVYHKGVTDAVNEATEKAAKSLVKRTKATAPVGARGSFRKNITSKKLKTALNGDTYVWYVKPPDHRLTHLLVHGHETRNGGRAKSDPFLQNALNATLPEYEADVREAVQRGK